jgi:hypothetical protein
MRSGLGLLVVAILVGLAMPAYAQTATLTLTFTDNATNETGFKTERCQGVACAPTVQAFVIPSHTGTGSTVFIDSALAEGTQFCYRLRATNTAGDSAYSNTACATTSVSIPNAPSSLSISAWLRLLGIDEEYPA